MMLTVHSLIIPQVKDTYEKYNNQSMVVQNRLVTIGLFELDLINKTDYVPSSTLLFNKNVVYKIITNAIE
jgi:hypothetical protein